MKFTHVIATQHLMRTFLDLFFGACKHVTQISDDSFNPSATKIHSDCRCCQILSYAAAMTSILNSKQQNQNLDFLISNSKPLKIYNMYNCIEKYKKVMMCVVFSILQERKRADLCMDFEQARWKQNRPSMRRKKV